MNKVACAPQVGSDMEVFLANDGGDVVPCVGLFEGTKNKPWRPPGMGLGYAIQEDNVMCEFNVPPVKSAIDGLNVMLRGRRMVEKQAALHGLHPIWGQTDYRFPKAALTSEQAQTIGCEADYNAYEGGAARNNLPDLTDWRSCGGHIHLGGDFKCPDFVAALFAELFISVGTKTPCGNGHRAKWYGRPGIYRPKPYGIEYRTPTNVWVQSEDVIHLTYHQALMCANYLTRTDALTLQATFRSFPWVKLHEYMVNGNPYLREELVVAAHQKGITL